MILSRELWYRSGHWDHYKDNMYTVEIDGDGYFTAAGLVPAGEFVHVRITGVSDGDLTGEIEE